MKKGRGVVVRQPFFYVHRFLRRCRMLKFVGKIRITFAKKHQPVAAPNVPEVPDVPLVPDRYLSLLAFVLQVSCFLYKKRDIYLVQTLTMTWLWITYQYVRIAVGEFVLHAKKLSRRAWMYGLYPKIKCG